MLGSVNTERSDTSSLTLNILMKICVHVCVLTLWSIFLNVVMSV